MKRVNFWKTLFLSALAVAAITGCSKDDSDEGGGLPSITVNGASTAVLGVDLAGGTTEAVEVVSSGDWTVTFSGSDVTGCTAVPASGGKGTTSLKFEIGASNTERTITAKLVTYGTIEGISGVAIPAEATITIKQNAGGSTEVKTNVKEIRAALTFPSYPDTAEITEDLTLTGIVVSDYEGNNINARQAMLVDNTTEPGAGITVRFNPYTSKLQMKKGAIVSIKIKGGKSQSYSGLYQIEIESSNPEVTVLDSNDNTPEAIEITDLSTLADYQSQLVKIYAQPVEDIRGAYYYDASLANSGGYVTRDFQTKTGGTVELSFNKYTGTTAGDNPWADKLRIPSKAGYVKGCVSVYSGGSQLTPRNADDLAGLTDELFTVEAQTSTIDQITTTGAYEVAGAKVVGVATKGFVMQDKTGVIFVYFDKTEPTIPALGNTVTVSGDVVTYGTNLQFKDPTKVTITDQGTDYELPSPTEVTADNIKSIVDGKPQYVKLTCELAKSGSYYNFTFLFSSNYTGSLCYPEASLADPYDKKTIDVEGWYVYTVNSKYFYVLANSIKENSNIASGSFTTQPATFEASNPQAQELTFEANAAAGNVKFSITGTNADKFSYSYTSGNTVTVKAAGDNTTSSTYTADLNLLSAAGDILATVTLKQSGVSTGAGYTLIDNVADITAGTYYMSGYSTEYKSGNNSVTFAPYSYHIWTGTVSGGDLVTVGYEFADGNLTVDPSATKEAVLITLEAVSGSANTYYIKSGDKYLKGTKDSNRGMGLVDTPDGAEWTFDTHSKGGIKISNTFGSTVYILGTAGAQSNMLRSYKDPASSLVYGVCFFKAN